LESRRAQKIKEAEIKLAEYSKALEAKLGSGWVFEVDWTDAGKNAKGGYRANPNESVVEYLIGGIVKNDLPNWDNLTVAAFNKICGANKKIVLTIGPDSDEYKQIGLGGRTNIKIDANGTRIVFNSYYFGCSWESWLLTAADQLKDTQAPPGVSGNFLLGEFKSIQSQFENLRKAEEELRQTLGTAWSLVVDWDSVEVNSRGSSYRDRIGVAIVKYLIGSIVKNDVKKMDSDVVEALNEKVEKAKTLRVALGPDTAEYKMERCNVTVDNTTGITLTFNAYYVGCELYENNVCKWALTNC